MSIFFQQKFLTTLNKIHKIKKDKSDPFLLLDDASKDWQLIDLGNIVLHVMLRAIREHYDLETLWTVGQEFDEKSLNVAEGNMIQDILDWHTNSDNQKDMPAI